MDINIYIVYFLKVLLFGKDLFIIHILYVSILNILKYHILSILYYGLFELSMRIIHYRIYKPNLFLKLLNILYNIVNLNGLFKYIVYFNKKINFEYFY